jgi:hypothetical protein
MFATIFAHATDFSGSYLDNLGRGLFIGFLLFMTYTFIWLGAVLWNFTWSWIDEQPCQRHNCLSMFVAKLTGYECIGGLYTWRSERMGSTDYIHLLPMLTVFAGPAVLITLLTFYSLTLTVVVAFALAHLTRYIRRMKKAFDKHVLDKDAHKEGE